MYIKFTVVTSTRVNLPEAYYYYYQHIVIVISTMHTEPQTSSVLTARRNVSTFIFLFDFVQQSWDTGTVGIKGLHFKDEATEIQKSNLLLDTQLGQDTSPMLSNPKLFPSLHYLLCHRGFSGLSLGPEDCGNVNTQQSGKPGAGAKALFC
ncbi:hypothetical protein TREES_T100014277 [Tupaia chinensis]|uniref:Uncharacterized protein n=1 Tax=Tupaia chinensis TaxID=246437 RepID=L9JID0_TUPCH|nr:hypothetical protein TREES_T100014277 [Tupaia chinensis]